jgi:hypothetical protein
MKSFYDQVWQSLAQACRELYAAICTPGMNGSAVALWLMLMEPSCTDPPPTTGTGTAKFFAEKKFRGIFLSEKFRDFYRRESFICQTPVIGPIHLVPKY